MKDAPLGKRQRHPIFVVKSAGTTIEFTDDRKLAHAAYDSGNDLDKGIWKVEMDGRAECVRRMIAGRELGMKVQV